MSLLDLVGNYAIRNSWRPAVAGCPELMAVPSTYSFASLFDFIKRLRNRKCHAGDNHPAILRLLGETYRQRYRYIAAAHNPE